MNNHIDFEMEDDVLCKYLGNDNIVVIPADVESIEAQTFLDCNTVEEIVIPDGIKCFISAYAFEHCYGLKRVYIGSTAKISTNEDCGGTQSIFFCCDLLERIDVSEDNEQPSNMKGVIKQ